MSRQLTYGRCRRRRIQVTTSALASLTIQHDVDSPHQSITKRHQPLRPTVKPWNLLGREDKFDLLLQQNTDQNIFDVTVSNIGNEKTSPTPIWKKQGRPKSYSKNSLPAATTSKSRHSTAKSTAHTVRTDQVQVTTDPEQLENKENFITSGWTHRNSHRSSTYASSNAAEPSEDTFLKDLAGGSTSGVYNSTFVAAGDRRSLGHVHSHFDAPSEVTETDETDTSTLVDGVVVNDDSYRETNSISSSADVTSCAEQLGKLDFSVTSNEDKLEKLGHLSATNKAAERSKDGQIRDDEFSSSMNDLREPEVDTNTHRGYKSHRCYSASVSSGNVTKIPVKYDRKLDAFDRLLFEKVENVGSLVPVSSGNVTKILAEEDDHKTRSNAFDRLSEKVEVVGSTFVGVSRCDSNCSSVVPVRDDRQLSMATSGDATDESIASGAGGGRFLDSFASSRSDATMTSRSFQSSRNISDIYELDSDREHDQSGSRSPSSTEDDSTGSQSDETVIEFVVEKCADESVPRSSRSGGKWSDSSKQKNRLEITENIRAPSNLAVSGPLDDAVVRAEQRDYEELTVCREYGRESANSSSERTSARLDVKDGSGSEEDKLDETLVSSDPELRDATTVIPISNLSSESIAPQSSGPNGAEAELATSRSKFDHAPPGVSGPEERSEPDSEPDLFKRPSSYAGNKKIPVSGSRILSIDAGSQFGRSSVDESGITHANGSKSSNYVDALNSSLIPSRVAGCRLTGFVGSTDRKSVEEDDGPKFGRDCRRRNDARDSNLFMLSSFVEDVVGDRRQQMLALCQQDGALSFEDCLSVGALNSCRKIGEGVYGEVFRMSDGGRTVALKIIPIEGDFLVNGAQQKTFQDILPEIIITSELSNLRNGTVNACHSFVKLERTICARGRYPLPMRQAWNRYNDEKEPENEDPVMFEDDQLYAIFEFQDGGVDLEHHKFRDASQALSVFLQLACTLAVAESELEFEHRDLHWGNVLIAATPQKWCEFLIDGRRLRVATQGLAACVIDFTLSRISRDGMSLYCDESNDEELFQGQGDHQFEVYRLMRQHNGNNWDPYRPFTNVLWLWYTLDKLINSKKFSAYRGAAHKRALKEMRHISTSLNTFDSAVAFVRRMTADTDDL